MQTRTPNSIAVKELNSNGKYLSILNTVIYVSV